MWVFAGKEGARFEVLFWLTCICRGGRGRVNIKKGGKDRAVMVKTIFMCIRLSGWAEEL